MSFEFKENLKKIRNEKKLSQKKLGELIGKKEITIRSYENGKIMPPLRVVKEIAEKLEISFNELMGIDNIKEMVELNIKTKKVFFILKRLEKLFNFYIKNEYYARNDFFICEYKDEKFYIKENDTKTTKMILTLSQASKLIKETDNYLEYLFYNINKENKSPLSVAVDRKEILKNISKYTDEIIGEKNNLK